MILLKSNKISFITTVGQKCENCDTVFKKTKGKKFCSKTCRLSHHPTKDEALNKYHLLGSWEKVAKLYKTNREIIRKIINNFSIKNI